MKFTKIIKADKTSDALKNTIKTLQDSLNKITYNLDNVKKGLRNISPEEMNNILNTINTFNKQLYDNLGSKLYGYKLTPEEIQKIKDVFDRNYLNYDIKETLTGHLAIDCPALNDRYNIDFTQGNDKMNIKRYPLDNYGGNVRAYYLTWDVPFDTILKALDNYVTKKSKKELFLSDAFVNIENKLDTKIKEGKQKKYVDWYGGTSIKDNSLEVLLSINREYRHPDEYFDMRGDEPKELKEFYQWENELFNIIDPFINKYNLELDMHA